MRAMAAMLGRPATQLKMPRPDAYGSFALNTFVVRTLGLSVVYAVWSGVGTVATALIGVLYFKEPGTALKLASIGLIVIGVLGVHAASKAA